LDEVLKGEIFYLINKIRLDTVIFERKLHAERKTDNLDP